MEVNIRNRLFEFVENELQYINRKMIEDNNETYLKWDWNFEAEMLNIGVFKYGVFCNKGITFEEFNKYTLFSSIEGLIKLNIEHSEYEIDKFNERF